MANKVKRDAQVVAILARFAYGEDNRMSTYEIALKLCEHDPREYLEYSKPVPGSKYGTNHDNLSGVMGQIHHLIKDGVIGCSDVRRVRGVKKYYWFVPKIEMVLTEKEKLEKQLAEIQEKLKNLK